MAKGKVKATMIKLVSTAGTGFFYTARKNTSSIQHKLAFKKFDPIVRQHVLFTEVRISRAKKA